MKTAPSLFLILFIIFQFIFATETQYIIIHPPAYQTAAQVIADLHSTEVAAEHQLITELIDTDIIAAAYPSDPLNQAIRKYLLDQIAANIDLEFVLLLGNEITVPPITDWYGNPADDFYTSALPYQSRPQLGTGRLVVEDQTEALQIVNKVRNFTLNRDPGVWRSKMVLMADDAYKQGGGLYSNEIMHVETSDIIREIVHPDLDTECLYGTEYSREYSGGGWPTQPDLTEDLIAAFNAGIGWLNYIGHGNEHTLADELIVKMDRDINVMSAPDGKLSTWVIGSCDFGHYDDAECMSEELMKKTDGVIAMVTPTRSLYSDAVRTFMELFYNNVSDYMNGISDYRMGDLLSKTKNGGTQYHYHLFGDPAMLLPFPRLNTIIESAPAELEILTQSEVILTAPYTGFDSHLIVRGPEQEVTQLYSDAYGDVYLSYTLPGQIAFQGDFQGSVSFYTPMDIQFCDDCTGMLYAYTVDTDSHGSAESKTDIPIIEPTQQIDDEDGPLITVEYMGFVLSNNDLLMNPYDLELVLEDPIGINVMGARGHDIRYWLDTEDDAQIITGDFEYDAASSTTGRIDITLPSDLSGLHNLYVEAWDNANNRSVLELTLCFTNCTPDPGEDLLALDETTSLLTPTGIVLSGDQVYASTAGGVLNYDLAGSGFSAICGDEGLENLDFLSMSMDGYSNLWLGANTVDGSLQIYHPSFGLQREISHLDIHYISDIDIGPDAAFAVYGVDTETGILEFAYDGNNLPYFQNHYRNFPVPVTEILDVDHWGDILYVTTSSGIFAGDFRNDILTSSSNWQHLAAGYSPLQFIAGDVKLMISGSQVYEMTGEDTWELKYSGISGTLLDAGLIPENGHYGILTSVRYYELTETYSLASGFPIAIPVSSRFTCTDRDVDRIVFGLDSRGILIWNTTTRDFEVKAPNTLHRNDYTALSFTSANELMGTCRQGTFHHRAGQYMHFLPDYYAGYHLLDELGPENFSAVSLNYTPGSNAPWSIVQNQIGNLVFSNSGMTPSTPGQRGGVIEINPYTHDFFVYDTTNGILDGLNGIYNTGWTNRYLTINQIKRDPAGNLWVVNPYSETYNHIAAIQQTDGLTWSHVTAPDEDSYLPQEVTFDVLGRAWFGMQSDIPMNNDLDEYAGGGLKVINTMGTINDESDDLWVEVLNPEILPGESIWSLVFDNTGILWVISSGGVMGCQWQETIDGITLTSISGPAMLTSIPFFQGDHIRVDHLNNKWISTKHSGVFVIRGDDLTLWPDADGINTSNSELLSDEVYDLAFDLPDTYVFMATTKGISSFDLSEMPNADPLSMDEPVNMDPAGYRLLSVYPNPFNPVTNIRYQIPVPGDISIRVFDLRGRQLAELDDGFRLAGEYQVEWHADRQSSGIYFIRLETENTAEVQKVVLVK